MTDLQERVAVSFSAQGLMTTLGAELVEVSRGEVKIAFSPLPALSQQHGYTHAGVLASVLDSACGYAALSVAPVGLDVLTVEFKVNFLRPAAADRFVAIGRVVRAGKTLTVCQGEVIGEQGSRQEVIAIMQATIFNVSRDA